MRTGIGVVGVLLAVALVGCPSGGPTAVKAFDPYKSNMPADPFEDWYPETIVAPEGTRYPYVLLRLPDTTALPGLDRSYINHVMAQLVTIARSNARLVKRMGTKEHDEAVGDFNEFAGEALENVEAETVPEGLRAFHDDLCAALALQQAHFTKTARGVAAFMKPVYEREALTEVAVASEIERALKSTTHIIEGKAASAKLTAAWAQLSARYGGHWDDPLRDSIYSHFRAMDL